MQFTGLVNKLGSILTIKLKHAVNISAITSDHQLILQLAKQVKPRVGEISLDLQRISVRQLLQKLANLASQEIRAGCFDQES